MDLSLIHIYSSKDAESGLTNKIRTGWNQVDLSGLGDSVCTVAINFEGSDSSCLLYTSTNPYAVEFTIFRCTLDRSVCGNDSVAGCIGQVNLRTFVIGCL